MTLKKNDKQPPNDQKNNGIIKYIPKNTIWYLIIISLCISPIANLWFYKDNIEYHKLSIHIETSKLIELTDCKKARNIQQCIAHAQELIKVKDEIKSIEDRLNQNISSVLNNYDKNIDILTFSLTFYAILITIISIFFSIRESSRIDEKLASLENLKTNLEQLEQKTEGLTDTINQIQTKTESTEEIKIDDSPASPKENKKNKKNKNDINTKDDDGNRNDF